MDSNRINQTSIIQSTQRQTPKDDFGSVMAQTVGQGVKVGAGVLSGALGSPVVSAAVTAVSGVINLTNNNNKPATTVGSVSAGGAGGVSGVTTGSGSSWDLLAAQQALQSDSQSFNMQYLQLQDQMQKESRDFTVVSNIMKVRQDTAKNAINNIH